MILDDPAAFNSKIRTQLDPNLVDQLTAYAASRNVPLPQTVLKALELFMLSAAEDAWRELSGGAGSEGNFSAAPLTFILERFLTISLERCQVECARTGTTTARPANINRKPMARDPATINPQSAMVNGFTSTALMDV